MVTVETKPVWSSSSFLIYAGGLTVLQGAIFAIAYLATQFHGAGEWTAWSLLVFVILCAVAYAFRRADQWLAAGIFAFASVYAWAILVGVTFYWWGWENGSFRNVLVFSWPRFLLEVLILLAATVTRWRFKFPFIRSISAIVGAIFVIDLLGARQPNSVATLALLIGLAYLAIGHVSDKPSTFWLHYDAGFLIGIPILYWAHQSTFDYAVIAFMALVYVIWAYWTKRSSWAVFGTVGFFIVAAYFVVKAVVDTFRSGMFGGPGSVISDLWFIPLAIGLLGFWLVLLGILGRWKKGSHGPLTTETKPIWNASSFLIYTGGLTVLLGAIVGLVYLGYEDRGSGARTGWTLLFLVIIYGIAHALRLAGRWLAAGILAFVSVLVWGVLVLFTITWIGWHPFGVFNLFAYASPFASWSWSRMLLWVLILGFASFNRAFFRFPFIRLISAVVFWLFVADLLTSFHGNWFAVVTLLTGLAYLLVGNVIDKPSAFWLHFIGGLLIGGVLVHWFRTSDGDFAVLAIFALLYVLVAFWTKRSSWAVLGTIGFVAVTDHYLGGVGHTGLPGAFLGVSGGETCTALPGSMPICHSTGFNAPWSPALAYGLLGFWLVGLGILGMRKWGPTHTAVVVATPAPVAPPAAAAATAAPVLEDPPAE
ncbi:MAG: hypothetical protein QOG85_1206 [Gaiellaceae bacterium]|nr:hypothetical protein [Gaiellaceae bacterium]